MKHGLDCLLSYSIHGLQKNSYPCADLIQGDIVKVGYCQGDIVKGVLSRGDIVQRDIVREPSYQLKMFFFSFFAQ